jgi:hypothetical protein
MKGIACYQETEFPEHPADVPLPQFVNHINPISVISKSGKHRPVVDLTKGGVNAYSLPWGLTLPTMAEVIPLLKQGALLAKRDWDGGFH